MLPWTSPLRPAPAADAAPVPAAAQARPSFPPSLLRALHILSAYTPLAVTLLDPEGSAVYQNGASERCGVWRHVCHISQSVRGGHYPR